MQQINKSKYPPYGKALADRQRFNNIPALVIICIGGNCWGNAKGWIKHPEFSVLVVTADLNVLAVRWPVKDCLCLIQWDGGASSSQVIELVKILLESGAVKVVVSPLQVDYSVPSHSFDIKQQRFIKDRECLVNYYPWAAA